MQGRKGTVLAILSLLFFVSSFLPLLYFNLLHLTDRWADQIRIRVFFVPETPESRAIELKDQWSRRKEVEQVTWIAKDQALEALLKEDRTKEGETGLEHLLADLGGNPLPHSVWIALKPSYRHSATVETLAGELKGISEVDGVQYDPEGILKLERLIERVRMTGLWGGGTIGVILLILTLLVFRGTSASLSSGIGIGAGGAAVSLLLAAGFYLLMSRTVLEGVNPLFFPVAWLGGWIVMGGILGGVGGLFSSNTEKAED